MSLFKILLFGFIFLTFMAVLTEGRFAEHAAF